MAWEKDPPNLQPSKGYLRIRKVNRAIMETWFREISIVDVDTVPEDGGITFTPLGTPEDLLTRCS